MKIKRALIDLVTLGAIFFTIYFAVPHLPITFVASFFTLVIMGHLQLQRQVRAMQAGAPGERAGSAV